MCLKQGADKERKTFHVDRQSFESDVKKICLLRELFVIATVSLSAINLSKEKCLLSDFLMI